MVCLSYRTTTVEAEESEEQPRTHTPNKSRDGTNDEEGETNPSADDNQNKDQDDGEMTSLSLGKPFQRLQFLVRDSTEIEEFDVSASQEVQNAQYEVSIYCFCYLKNIEINKFLSMYIN